MRQCVCVCVYGYTFLFVWVCRYLYVFAVSVYVYLHACLCRWHCTKSSDCQVRVRGAQSNLYGVNVTKAVIGAYM